MRPSLPGSSLPPPPLSLYLFPPAQPDGLVLPVLDVPREFYYTSQLVLQTGGFHISEYCSSVDSPDPVCLASNPLGSQRIQGHRRQILEFAARSVGAEPSDRAAQTL